MKLVYIANARLPTEKAHGLQIMQMCAAFARAGVEVTLVVPRRWHNPIVGDPFVYYGVEKNFRVIKVVCLDLIWTHTQLGFLIEQTTFSWHALRVARAIRPEVIYTRDPFLLLWAKDEKAKLALEAHTGPSAFLKKQKDLAQRIGGLIAITSFVRDRWISWGIGRDKSMVASDAVDLHPYEELRAHRDTLRSQLSFAEKEKIIGYVGMLETMGMSKGIDTLLHAMVLVQEHEPEARLVVVGGPSEKIKQYTALACSLGLGKAVQFVGQVDQATARAYEVAADVLVAPTPRTDFSMHEASPMKIFEYRATGRPIVASDLPAMREAVGDYPNVVFVAPEDADALAVGMGEALRAPPHEVHTPPLSWDERAQRIIAFISSSSILTN